ncbi:MAG: TIGR02444 family protein [Gammaproteobacteria bacterium]|nr:TIGR02444 family protein [Gammaproteobacteria bacterium]MBT8444085.1 TIGR02444 family protein [Gammaproteobacteria bacterium]NND35512.1 TIGR02444 family protein [Gammaproteobacteria bacterium]
MKTEFQDSPFWDFSLSIYGRPGVADACLFLQDRYGLDVNLILFCVWVGSTGRGSLAEPAIDACVSRTSDWRECVIEPLRQIRRACRDEPLGVPEFLLQVFRPSMHDVELDAEHVEQLVLAELASSMPAEEVADDVRFDDARRSLLRYVEQQRVQRDSSMDECLVAILRAAFPGGGRDGLA